MSHRQHHSLPTIENSVSYIITAWRILVSGCSHTIQLFTLSAESSPENSPDLVSLHSAFIIRDQLR